jgi:hypothetical protein
MEKMIFTNSLNQTIEFSSTSKYRWRNVDDFGGTDTVSQSVQSPYQDGSTSVGDSYFNAKIMEVQFVLVSATIDADMRTLYSVINPKLGLGTLTITLGASVFMLNKVKTRTLPTRMGDNGNGVTFQFSRILFEIFDPVYSDVAFTEQIAVNESSLLEFDIDITDDFMFGEIFTSGYPVVNAGDVACPITIEITGALTAPLEVENVTTGEKVKVVLSLTADEQLIITTEIDNINVIKKTISTGAEVVAFQYIDIAESTFFYLPVGTTYIKITSTSGEIYGALLKFKNRYVGI